MSKRFRKISLRKKDSKGSIGEEVTKSQGLKRSKSASFLGRLKPHSFKITHNLRNA